MDNTPKQTAVNEHPIKSLLNNPPKIERHMYSANIFQGKRIIASFEIMAKHEQEAIVLAAKALKIKVRKSYDRH